LFSTAFFILVHSLMSWSNNIKYRYMLYRMGYYSGQAGIMRRFLGEEGSWKGHLSKTKEYILDAVARTGTQKVRILGSGWLLDIPLTELVNNGVHVTLVDIAHPRQVMHRYRENALITFQTADITGGAIELAYDFAKRKKSNLGAFELIGSLSGLSNPFHFATDELVISANILSQTSVLITDYLLMRGAIKPADVEPISRIVQANHMNLLLQARGVLVADYEEEFFDESGVEVGTRPTVFIPIEKGEQVTRWTWTFDTKETYSDGFRTNLNVVALMLF